MTTLHKMTHKEMTAHIRGRIKKAGIRARVKMNQPLKGWPGGITIDTPTFEAEFTADEARVIAEIAIANGLTKTRGMPIDLEIATMTGNKGQSFEYPA